MPSVVRRKINIVFTLGALYSRTRKSTQIILSLGIQKRKESQEGKRKGIRKSIF